MYSYVSFLYFLISYMFIPVEFIQISLIKNNKLELLKQFHDELFEQYQDFLSGDKHLISKMYSFWEYFSLDFIDHKKGLKKIKKSKSAQAYQMVISELFNDNSENISILS